MKLSISMTRQETVGGWLFLAISMFVLPSLFILGSSLLATPLSATEINLLYFAVNFLCAGLIFRKFLVQSIKALFRKPWQCLKYAAIGYGVYQFASFLLGFAILWIRPDFSNVNDGSIAQMAGEHSALMAIATVFLVPVYEELFYRGLFFQELHRKNRWLAYCVSVFVFASIHVMGYVGMYDPVTLLLCFVQYLPAGITLAWAYEKSGTILVPMAMHILINLIGFLYLR